MSTWLERSQKHLFQQLSAFFKPLPSLTSLPKRKILYRFEDLSSLSAFIIGSDKDIGGESVANWAFNKNAASKTKTAVFYGNLSTTIPDSSKSTIDRSGYVALRSKQLPMTLFHHPHHDVSFYRYLEIRARGNKRLWMINIQTDSLYPAILWQHRLFFTNPGEWETIRIPFRDFVKTAYGVVQKNQLKMDKSQMKTIGFSLLRQPGEFELEIEEISAVNSDLAIGDYDIELPDKETMIMETKKKLNESVAEFYVSSQPQSTTTKES